jgi:hypothetical protein
MGLGVETMDEETLLYCGRWGRLKITERGLVYSDGQLDYLFLLNSELDLIIESLYNMSRHKRYMSGADVRRITRLIYDIIKNGLDRVLNNTIVKVEVKH